MKDHEVTEGVSQLIVEDHDRAPEDQEGNRFALGPRCAAMGSRRPDGLLRHVMRSRNRIPAR
jgi:hypothetical protein